MTAPATRPDHPRPRPSRRAVLRGALAAGTGVGLSAAVSGCGTPVATGLGGGELDPNSLTFWNLFGGGDGQRLTTMLDKYRSAPGSPTLVSSTFAWGDPYYTKVSLATVGGQAPDVAVSHLTRMQNLAQADLLTPISETMLGEVGLRSTDFNQVTWRAAKREGKAYGVPLDTHPFVLFYNVDVCREAGLLGTDGRLKPIKGVQQWEAALAAAKKATGRYAIASASVSEFATPWRLFQTLYSQRAGATPFLGDSGRKITVSQPDALATLAYLQRMNKQGWMAPATDYAGSMTMMFTGKAAFFVQGEWEITSAQGIKGLKFGMAPVPQIWDKPAAQADSHMFILPRKDRSPEQTRRAMGFIKAMLRQSLTWAEGGHIPSYLPTLRSAAYRKLEPQSDYASVANHTAYDALAWYSGSGSVFENIAGAQIGLVQQGQISPAQALANIRAQLKPYTSAANPLVEDAS